jgi:hypothetical protein
MNYVIFRTGGTVTIDGGAEQINIKKSCVYIAGQTAPGGGFQLKAVDTAPIATRNNQNPNNLVVRYLRIRADNTEQRDVVSLYDGRNQIWDHISASMGTDETWSYNNCTLAQGCHDANDLTFQNSIIGPTLTPHSTNSLIKGSDDGSTRLSRVSIHHNLFIHATVRSPRIVACDTCQVINNVTYNWESWVGGIEPGEGNNPCRFDYVRNYWEEGPWTSDNSDNIRHDDLTPPITLLCRIYAYRNISDGFQTDSTANQKNLFKFRDSGGPLPDSIFEASRFGDPRTPITEQHAAAARDSILARVGAYRKLDDSACTGGWLANRDALDDTLIYHVTNGTGPSNDAENDDVSDYGGLPTLAAGTPCTDSDNDGMPDAYEDLYAFLDKNDGTDYKEDNDGDGFINLEEYLNGTPP